MIRLEIEKDLDVEVLDESNIGGKLIVLSDEDYGNCTPGDFDSIDEGNYTFMSLSEYKKEYK